jgi:hypothetical protein
VNRTGAVLMLAWFRVFRFVGVLAAGFVASVGSDHEYIYHTRLKHVKSYWR